MQLTKERVFLLRQAIVKITQILTGSGIEVTQRGVSAYVRSDPKTGVPVQVNLPFLPDNAPEELVDAIQGFLDHEVGHVLFSDFTKLKRLSNRTEHAFSNCLEDARIEKAMAEKFSGCAANLSKTGDFFLNSIIKPRLAELQAEGADEATLTQVLLAPALRAASGQFAFQEFMDEDDKWTLVPELTTAINSLRKDIAKIDSTGSTVTVAKKLIATMSPTPATPPAPPPPAPSTPPEEDEEEEEGPAPSLPTPSPSEEPEEPEPESDDEGAAPPSPSAAPEPDDEGGAPGAGEEGEGTPTPTAGPSTEDGEDAVDESEGGVGSGEGGSSGGGEESRVSSDALSKIDREGANDFDDSVSNAISSTAAESSKKAPYRVYTTELDVVEPLHIGKGFDPAMLKALEDKVEGMAGPMQKDLERAIVARSRAQWEGGLRKGRLNVTALSRVAVGDERVFRRRMETTTRDVAIELVVDCSGSMSGSKIHTAAASAFALSQVLDRLKIANEVIGFTTGEMSSEMDEKMREEATKHGISYSRMEPLYMPIVKSFNERLSTEVKNRFA